MNFKVSSLTSKWLLLSALLVWICLSAVQAASQIPSTGEKEDAAAEQQITPTPGRVGVAKVSSDQAINKRLTGILRSTGWFDEITVDVRDGVVFLDGLADSSERREWAGLLAGKTEDVVAVVNRIRVAERSPWNLSPASEEFKRLWRVAIQKLPLAVIGLLILILTGLAAKLSVRGVRRTLSGRIKPLLSEVTARAVSISVFIIGIYILLQVVGLTRLAATVLGGTGLFGLIAGIAFRDILENFLASILISLRNPFRLGDLIEVAGHLGVVQHVTTRGTVLMDLDGNHVQIPNATIYKSVIRNYTANPNRRDYFEVGIGYENDSARAQEIAITVLNDHPAVLANPEALVLVDRLGAATVVLKIYYWYDGAKYNFLRVKSSLIRLVKKAFEQEGISMPDEAREIIFPEGVPVRMLKDTSEPSSKGEEPRSLPETKESEPVSTSAEGNLATEDEQLREQARHSRMPEEGAGLLES